MICEHCGKETRVQSVEGALNMLHGTGLYPFLIEEAHKGGFYIFRDFETPAAKHVATLREAAQWIWEQRGYPEAFA